MTKKAETTLVYEATLKDLIDELEARFPSGTLIGIVGKDNTYSIRLTGNLDALCQLSSNAAKCAKEHKDRKDRGF